MLISCSIIDIWRRYSGHAHDNLKILRDDHTIDYLLLFCALREIEKVLEVAVKNVRTRKEYDCKTESSPFFVKDHKFRSMRV